MIREIELKGKIIKYDFKYKNVKNLNLRIKPDGSIFVSANRKVSSEKICAFLISKSDFILSSLKKFENKPEVIKTEYFSACELQNFIIEECKNIYPYFEKLGVKYPVIKFRNMVSQWGNCYYKRGILTFSLNLRFAPKECIQYVAAHEFTHFLVPNHSKKFYMELSKVMPDWKSRKEKLKQIKIK